MNDNMIKRKIKIFILPVFIFRLQPAIQSYKMNEALLSKIHFPELFFFYLLFDETDFYYFSH